MDCGESPDRLDNLVTTALKPVDNTVVAADENEIADLKAEIARLRGLLAAHGIDVTDGAETPAEEKAVELNTFSTAEKIALFRSLFRGRGDAFAVRWESASTGKSGYSPVCANEWRPGICEKPRIKCGDCAHRSLVSLSDEAVFDHLSGRQTIGVYPLREDGSCHFLAVDFDDEDWRGDALAFADSCAELNVPASIEVSRSGKGAHVWIFFASAVSAREARSLGTAILSRTCARRKLLKLTSYDRLFPNQDIVPTGGFGNLIALPLQKRARENDRSVFVDRDFRPFPDQWSHLASVDRMNPADIQGAILRTTGAAHPLDVAFIDDEDLAEPWARPRKSDDKLSGELPASVTITISNQLYFEKSALTQSLSNRLIRLAAFQNPEFYKAQAMRLSVWDKPRLIGCAENFPRHIALPRGCLGAVLALFETNGIAAELIDKRTAGEPVDVKFGAALRLDQELAVQTLLAEDIGVFCAPTGFGKTVSAAAIIARRSVSTLILVHRTELLKQWKETLELMFEAPKGTIGVIGGGRRTATGKIDIAVMQSVSRKGEVNELVENYGQIIVDECHHVGAVSFDSILKTAKAKYVLGLTATPIRRDGRQPIIFMQCGPLRYRAKSPASAPQDLQVSARYFSGGPFSPGGDIQSVFREIAGDPARLEAIAAEVRAAFLEGRKILVLTERTEHAEAIFALLSDVGPAMFLLHGRVKKKERERVFASLGEMADDLPRVLVATGRLIGEGFDHPPLDTLVLAMPISWKGTVQQYAGRLTRERAGKTSVRIIDFVDQHHPALVWMWEKRKRTYKTLGYRVTESG